MTQTSEPTIVLGKKLPRHWQLMLAALALFVLLWVIRTQSVNDFLVGVQQPDGSIVFPVISIGPIHIGSLSIGPWEIKGGFVPGDIIVLVHKSATIALGLIAGVGSDYVMFPYGRPDLIVRDPDDSEPWKMGDAIAFSGACLRRALVVVGLMFAFGLTL